LLRSTGKGTVKILYLPSDRSQQRQLEKRRFIYPVLLAMQAQYHRDQGHEVYWERCDGTLIDKYITEPEHIDFLKLPAPDRIFTNSKDPRYQQNGNFKHHPATYIQVADGCAWGRCVFCVERKRAWKVRPVLAVHEELKTIKEQGFREVFDDSGSFPKGEWLDEFLGMENPGLVFGCNARMEEHPWRLMKRWGFRMVLFGIESQNQRTLDMINKGVTVSDIRHVVAAAKAGLDCHGAFMIFPWETHEETMHTINAVKKLLINGVLKTAQCSLYDVGKGRDTEKERYTRKLYEVAYSPRFWMNKILSIRNRDDLKYLIRQIKEGLRK